MHGGERARRRRRRRHEEFHQFVDAANYCINHKTVDIILICGSQTEARSLKAFTCYLKRHTSCGSLLEVILGCAFYMLYLMI